MNASLRSAFFPLALATLWLAACASFAGAQTVRRDRLPTPPHQRVVVEEDEGPVEFDKMNMSGPRFGVTYVVGAGDLIDRLEDNDMSRVLSQFGWHFERRVTPHGGGPQFVVEGVPMVAGVEYGTIVPSLTLAMGVRFPSGWEFGIGPNIVAIGTENEDDLQTSLVTAFGYSFQYSGVSLPVNLAVATNPEGSRLSLIFGYAIRR